MSVSMTPTITSIGCRLQDFASLYIRHRERGVAVSNVSLLSDAISMIDSSVDATTCAFKSVMKVYAHFLLQSNTLVGQYDEVTGRMPDIFDTMCTHIAIRGIVRELMQSDHGYKVDWDRVGDLKNGDGLCVPIHLFANNSTIVLKERHVVDACIRGDFSYGFLEMLPGIA